jgi:hypothetical protein
VKPATGEEAGPDGRLGRFAEKSGK